METGCVDVEWRIENFRHWCREVHGDCIESPKFGYPLKYMQLYPKGIYGLGEHLVVCFCAGTKIVPFSGDLTFYSSDGALLCKQPVNAEWDEKVLELPPGPKFEDVLSRIRDDFITVKFRMKDTSLRERRMRTTINVLKLSLEINPKWIEKIKSNETKDFLYIELSPIENFDTLLLKICTKNNTVQFMIEPQIKDEYPFAVKMCISLTRSDSTVDNCVQKEHVFRDNSPWTFPKSLEKEELVGKGISLLFCLKTKDLVESPFYMSCPNSCVSIESKNKICFPEKAPSTDPATSNKPQDSVQVLTKDLMCLFQDQKFSDITLKCNNVSFPVHKNILSARSPVLDRLLSSEMKEAASSEVDIGDLNPSTLGLFLTYLYTGAVEEELQDDSALKLYYTADKYQVLTLKKECSKFLCANVSISNVCNILSLADRHRDNELTAASHDFILDNYNEVLRSKEWSTLKRSEPILVAETLTQFAMEGSVRKHHHPQ